MPKLCEHLLNLKQEKIANLLGKCALGCTGNRAHAGSELDVCLSCGETRCLYHEKLECSYLHSYGTRHPLVYRIAARSLYCFTCQQTLTDALQDKEAMDNSNSKVDKIVDAHSRVIEIARKLHERIEEKALLPPEPEKKVEKAKKEKVVKESKQEQSMAEEKREAREEESREGSHKEHLQVFGLKNLGNTCFFNATLQCLYATESLHVQYDGLALNTQSEFGKTGEITLLFRKFLKNSEKQLNPKGIFSWVCRSKGVYKHMDQQDAQELLGVLLNGLIDGEKFWMGEEKAKALPKGRKNTITERIFGFYLASRLECLDCAKVSWSVDFSLEVAVSLAKTFSKKAVLPEGAVPAGEIKEEGLVYPQFKESGSIIDTFFAPEYLGKDNFFSCEGCQSQKALRKFYLKDPPAVLVLTLKRFNNNLSKNNAEVKVAPSMQLQGHCLNPGALHYELYAMIIHGGTARGGHYTACTRRGEGWVYFSDSSFKIMPWEKVRGCQPYILFYRRTPN